MCCAYRLARQHLPCAVWWSASWGTREARASLPTHVHMAHLKPCHSCWQASDGCEPPQRRARCSRRRGQHRGRCGCRWPGSTCSPSPVANDNLFCNPCSEADGSRLPSLHTGLLHDQIMHQAVSGDQHLLPAPPRHCSCESGELARLKGRMGGGLTVEESLSTAPARFL